MNAPRPRAPRLTGLAAELFAALAPLPIVSPHGHCDPAWWAEDTAFPDPAALLITPDHYLFRMLYSRGVALDDLGLGPDPATRDSPRIFRTFAAHWDAFLGTPTRVWLEHTLHAVIGVDRALTPENADAVHDRIADWIADPANRPRALYDRFGIEVLATTDPAGSDLAHHAAIRASGWGGSVIPTFRPDDLIDPARPDHAPAVTRLAEQTGTDTGSYAGYLDAIRARRAAFRALGATATDHDVPELATHWLSRASVEDLYLRRDSLAPAEARAFHGHMLIEMAQMSIEDGMVMQIHAGVARSTNPGVAARFGSDMGADIPRAMNWVDGLGPLLARVGNDPAARIIVFTLDEAAYARELAPMAGHWPALRLGPPWWFHDSPAGIRRYFDSVVETAGYENLAGFNDDTRAFLSIPARHDMWRRGVALHLAEQVERGVLHRDEAERLGPRLACDLAREAYRLGT